MGHAVPGGVLKPTMTEIEKRGLWNAFRRVARDHHCTVDELRTLTRTRSVARARIALWTYLQTNMGFTGSYIGSLCGCEGASVCHAIARSRAASSCEKAAE